MKNKFLITLISLFLMASCANEKTNISLFLYTDSDTFLNSLKDSVIDKFASNNNYELNTFYGQNSQYVQINQIIDEINNKSDLLLINLVDRLAASSIIEKAELLNVPIIFFNKEPLAKDIVKSNNAFYVGTNPIFEGEGQAEIVDNLFDGVNNFKYSSFDKNKDGKLQVVQIKGEQGHQDTEQRSQYSLKKLLELGYEVEILATTYADWSRDVAKVDFSEMYEEILNNNNQIELILSNNDDMALGVIDYLTSLKEYDSSKTFLEQYFPIIGVDATEVGLKAINDNLLYGTIRNNRNTQADAIYKLAEIILNKGNFEEFEYDITNKKFVRIDGEKITKDLI